MSEGQLTGLKGNKVLFDLKECDELFQKDKSLKQMKDIREIQKQIMDIKHKELNFYKNLRLDNQSKHKIFGIKYGSNNSDLNKNTNTIPETDELDQEINNNNNNNNNSNTVNGKVIVQDPLQGNLIMTIQEYNEVYLRDPLNY